MATREALNEMTRLVHEDDPVVLDHHEQTRTGTDTELLARFLGDDDLVLATQCDRRGTECTETRFSEIILLLWL